MKRNKIAVYTATFDDYDVILPPYSEQDDIDFYCFTNKSCQIPRPYTVITSGFERSASDKVDTIRLKCLGHRVLKDYDILIWIDGNIRIIGNIRPFINELIGQGEIFTNLHRSRDCIYDEADECIALGKVETTSAVALVSNYQKIGFPRKFGLHETTVLVRVQASKNVQKFNKTWWQNFQNGAHRDQLSFDFVRWRLGVKVENLGVDYFGGGNMFFKVPHVPKIMLNNLRIWKFICRCRTNSKKYIRLLGKIMISITLRASKIEKIL